MMSSKKGLDRINRIYKIESLEGMASLKTRTNRFVLDSEVLPSTPMWRNWGSPEGNLKRSVTLI
jgi:hypothetical protein